MCYYYYYTIWFFWTERLGECGGLDFTLLFISVEPSASTHTYFVIIILLYGRKRVPIVSARVPGRPTAVYYITLLRLLLLYHVQHTRVWESKYNVQSTYFVSQFYAI